MSTPQGGKNSESGVIRITRKAVAGAGKPPMNGEDADLEASEVEADVDDAADTDADAEASPSKAAGSKGSSAGSRKGAQRKGAPAKKAAGARAGAQKSTPAKTGQRKAVPAKAGARSGGQPPRRPGAPAGRPSGRRPAPAVVVAKARNWTRISLITGAIVVFLVIVGYGVYAIQQNGQTFEQKADSISGVVDYRKTNPAMLTRNHVTGVVNYKVSPPVGGDHNPNYQRCAADVYSAPIANENAVHALEHGSVWITYRPDLPASQVAQLTAEVKKYSDFILMSPYPGLSSPISLQAWGFQLKVNSATDPRIDKFVQDLRVNATMEPGIDCTSGNYVTATGTQPHNLGGPVQPSAPAATPSQ